jgi:hypothetical protein
LRGLPVPAWWLVLYVDELLLGLVLGQAHQLLPVCLSGGEVGTDWVAPRQRVRVSCMARSYDWTGGGWAMERARRGSCTTHAVPPARLPPPADCS